MNTSTREINSPNPLEIRRSRWTGVIDDAIKRARIKISESKSPQRDREHLDECNKPLRDRSRPAGCGKD